MLRSWIPENLSVDILQKRNFPVHVLCARHYLGHRSGKVHKADKAPKGVYSLVGNTSHKRCEENNRVLMEDG